MIKTALIGGTVFLDHEVLQGGEWHHRVNEFGEVDMLSNDRLVFIPRHGRNSDIPPHVINHQAVMKALKDCGIEEIVAVNSVGSLNVSIAPGSLIVPDEYISLWGEKSCFNDSLTHITPGLDERIREGLLKASGYLGVEVKDRGIYFQTTGPRLETRAEVRMLAAFADIVGMTMGSEATAARENSLRYASICSVDNYANGLSVSPLTNEDIRLHARESAEKIKRVVFAFLAVQH